MIEDGERGRMILLLEMPEETLARLKAYRDSVKTPEFKTISDVVLSMIETELQMWDHTCRMFEEADEE